MLVYWYSSMGAGKARSPNWILGSAIVSEERLSEERSRWMCELGWADERQGRGFHVQRSKRIETSPRKLGAPKANWCLIGRAMREVGPLPARAWMTPQAPSAPRLEVPASKFGASERASQISH